MAKATGEFICITDVPRASVANALQVQGRTDYVGAVAQVMSAFAEAAKKVSGAGGKISEFRDAVASARLAVNNATDLFVIAVTDAERLFQAGIDLQTDEPEPPQPEVSHA